MIWIYRIMFLPIFLLMSPYYLRRMMRRGGYCSHFINRFGFVPKIDNERNRYVIWIQAVSVGEVEAIKPLIHKICAQDSEIGIYLTTTTSTGFTRANELYGNIVLAIAYFPINFCLFSKIAWRRIQPSLAVLMESEVWPEHICEANKRNVPVVLINGRCSDRSFNRYAKIKFVTKWLFGKINKILAASELDADRFKDLGAPSDRIYVTGNMKFDCFSAQDLLDSAGVAELKSRLGKDWCDATILVGASTWPGEEELLLEFYTNNKRAIKNLKLIIVPRHAERRAEVESVLVGTKYRFRSKCNEFNDSPDVYVVDTTGELKKFLQIADVVFVGKSMCKNFGGQTPIEAAALAKPIVYGPNMQNFRQVCNGLECANASVMVRDKDDLFDALTELLSSNSKRILLSEAAKNWHKSNVGASVKTYDALIRALK